MTTLQKLVAQMLRISEAINLPKHYHNDLSIDVATILNSEATQFVWLLRTHGSCILPVGQGAHPIHITYYLSGTGRDSSSKCYLIDCTTCTVQEISIAKAILLSNYPPEIGNSRCLETIRFRVNAILNEGCNRALWGVFSPPQSAEQFNWEGWLSYFAEQKNQPMTEFMQKAISAIHPAKTS